jgi:hypothetical protein
MSFKLTFRLKSIPVIPLTGYKLSMQPFKKQMPQLQTYKKCSYYNFGQEHIPLTNQALLKQAIL